MATMHGPGGPSVAAAHGSGGTGYDEDYLRRDTPTPLTLRGIYYNEGVLSSIERSKMGQRSIRVRVNPPIEMRG